jgi:hypothetical protein
MQNLSMKLECLYVDFGRAGTQRRERMLANLSLQLPGNDTSNIIRIEASTTSYDRQANPARQSLPTVD